MNAAILAEAPQDRRRIAVRGIVQGVGFRPFVHRLAREMRLAGTVRNDGAGVTIDVQGEPPALDRFVARIAADAPRLARVDEVRVVESLPPRPDARGFEVVESVAGGPLSTSIGPDSAVCPDCLAELLDPDDRRYRYAFVNCTNCGPRYTITRSLPYDRPQTSMAGFAQCPACLAEYRAPGERRFHAEPNACPVCGPQLLLVDRKGEPIEGDPIARATGLLRAGCIVAIKGLGGFHLACDARNAQAVATLRERKAREEKPFAVMVANVASLHGLSLPGEGDAALLQSAERPVVLSRKAPDCDDALKGVAPGLAWLGAMLPYTPLQYLLFHEAAGRPGGTAWLADAQPLVLVMTSANPGGEPLVIGNDEARRRLHAIADALLVHDRDIVVRCDDSVVRVGASGAPQFVRRARGYTPRAIRMSRQAPPVLATGGYFKATVCATRGDEAFLSQHVGDVDNAPTCEALDEAIGHLLATLEIVPRAVAHDLHPDFYSTCAALRLADRLGVPAIEVQHHHAHVAAVLAEHRVDVPALGLALDGVGLGTDGSAWGGELVRVDGPGFARLSHLAPLALPGGDRAAREPWRMAAAALSAIGRGHEIAVRFVDEPGAPTVARMLAQQVRAPQTTSMGRWFDAAAGLLGVRRRMAFEGQAAMLLEGLAERHGPVAAERSLFALRDDGVLDLAPLVPRLAGERDQGRGAALFHATLVEALAEWVSHHAQAAGLRLVACSGGCFLNAILSRGLRPALAARGLAMLEAREAPPNDGGLALGQAWVARNVLLSRS
jgi:hydrogenase maturation protein HypF